MTPMPAFTRAEPDARRLSLIEATARVLAAEGAGGASVRAIAREAGVSPGLVGHYFDGVDALIAATYAHVGERVSAALEAAMAAAGTTRARGWSPMSPPASRPPIADPELLATWIAFWSLVKAQRRDRRAARRHLWPAIATIWRRCWAIAASRPPTCG